MPLARLFPRPELWTWINMLQDGISPSRSQLETCVRSKCLCLVSLSPDHRLNSASKRICRGWSAIVVASESGLTFFDSFPEGGLDGPRSMAASPIPSIRSGTMRESGTAALPYVHTHPTEFKDAERAGGRQGESQPRRPAQEQQLAARRRRTAHPTVIPCHEYVHVEGIKEKCCQPH